MTPKKCDIIIPVWDQLESTEKCLSALRDNTRYPYRLIIVDNASSGPAKAFLDGIRDSFPGTILIRNSVNLGFVKAVNQGIVASEAPYICILNNDAYVDSGWLLHLVETMESGPGNIGLLNPTSNVFGKDRADGSRGQWQELGSCKGFCMLLKRDLVRKIGLFDEAYGMGYFEEKDFSRRAIEAGFILGRAKSSYVFHKDRLSFDRIEARDEIFKRNENIYNRKWGRSLSLAFISKGNNIDFEKDLLYELLKKGHRLNIFFIKGKVRPRLKDHIEIRYFPIKRPFFGYGVLFKLWERRRKKKIEIIFSNDDGILKLLDRFKFAHQALVAKGANGRIPALCETKAREG